MWIGGTASGGGGFIGFLPIVVLIPIMYFVMIRPQQRRQKQWQEMLGSIKAGDREEFAASSSRSRTIRSSFAWRRTASSWK
jgi:uncharacterized membrane protein